MALSPELALPWSPGLHSGARCPGCPPVLSALCPSTPLAQSWGHGCLVLGAGHAHPAPAAWHVRVSVCTCVQCTRVHENQRPDSLSRTRQESECGWPVRVATAGQGPQRWQWAQRVAHGTCAPWGDPRERCAHAGFGAGPGLSPQGCPPGPRGGRGPLRPHWTRRAQDACG